VELFDSLMYMNICIVVDVNCILPFSVDFENM